MTVNHCQGYTTGSALNYRFVVDCPRQISGGSCVSRRTIGTEQLTVPIRFLYAGYLWPLQRNFCGEKEENEKSGVMYMLILNSLLEFVKQKLQFGKFGIKSDAKRPQKPCSHMPEWCGTGSGKTITLNGPQLLLGRCFFRCCRRRREIINMFNESHTLGESF